MDVTRGSSNRHFHAQGKIVGDTVASELRSTSVKSQNPSRFHRKEMILKAISGFDHQSIQSQSEWVTYATGCVFDGRLQVLQMFRYLAHVRNRKRLKVQPCADGR